VHEVFIETSAYASLTRPPSRLFVTHEYGASNVLADCASRAKYDELARLYAQLGMRGERIRLTSVALAFLERCLRRLGLPLARPDPALVPAAKGLGRSKACCAYDGPQRGAAPTAHPRLHSWRAPERLAALLEAAGSDAAPGTPPHDPGAGLIGALTARSRSQPPPRAARAARATRACLPPHTYQWPHSAPTASDHARGGVMAAAIRRAFEDPGGAVPCPPLVRPPHDTDTSPRTRHRRRGPTRG